jgi:hypothetical protein
MKTLKKVLIVVLIIFLGVITYSILILVYDDHTFVENNFKKYTGVKDHYIVRINYHTNHSSYIEAIISNSDKRMLLNKFKFEDNLSKLRGRVEPEFLTENPNYVYYVIEDGYGPYGYIVFALEKNGNTLIVYELAGN